VTQQEWRHLPREQPAEDQLKLHDTSDASIENRPTYAAAPRPVCGKLAIPDIGRSSGTAAHCRKI